MRFTDRVAMVTGAARGIGRATALLLAREGARVAAVDVDDEALERLAHEMAQAGTTCAIEVIDVSVERQVSASVSRVIDRLGRIDILINAVGGSTVVAHPDRCVEELSVDEWERVLSFNLRGTFLCTQAVVPHMKRQRSGRIVNLSSIVARGDESASRANAGYITAKAGIRALTTKLAHELGPFGITCNATAPGLTLTARIEDEVLAGRDAAQRRQMIDTIPLRRHATPEDQARVIAFLASDDAAFVSGQTLEVTGGQ